MFDTTDIENALEHLDPVTFESDLDETQLDMDILAESVELAEGQYEIDEINLAIDKASDIAARLDALNTAIADHGVSQSQMKAVDATESLRKTTGLPVYAELPVNPTIDATSEAACEGLTDTVKKILKNIADFFRKLYSTVKNWIGGLFTSNKKVATKCFNMSKELDSLSKGGDWDKLKGKKISVAKGLDKFPTALEGNAIDSLLKDAGGIVRLAEGAIGNAGSDALKAIRGAAKKFIDTNKVALKDAGLKVDYKNDKCELKTFKLETEKREIGKDLTVNGAYVSSIAAQMNTISKSLGDAKATQSAAEALLQRVEVIAGGIDKAALGLDSKKGDVKDVQKMMMEVKEATKFVVNVVQKGLAQQRTAAKAFERTASELLVLARKANKKSKDDK